MRGGSANDAAGASPLAGEKTTGAAGASSRTALVTGAGGFIGSHLVEALLERGWQVRALVHYGSDGGWGHLARLQPQPPPALEVVPGDVTDPATCRRAVEGCSVVFHLAALVSIPYSYRAARAYLETNTGGTLNLAQAALELGVDRLVLTSTSEVYGSARYTPIDEAHPLQAQSPYAASKIAAEKVVEALVCAFDLPAVVVRPFNTYGPRQSLRAVIPVIVTQALAAEELRLGSLDPVRDLTFVADTVAGLVAAGTTPGIDGEVLNLGSGEAVSIGELARLVLGLVGRDLPIVLDERRLRPPASEVKRLVSDNRRAREVLGWQPRVPLEAGLKRVIAWTREHREAAATSYVI